MAKVGDEHTTHEDDHTGHAHSHNHPEEPHGHSHGHSHDAEPNEELDEVPADVRAKQITMKIVIGSAALTIISGIGFMIALMIMLNNGTLVPINKLENSNHFRRESINELLADHFYHWITLLDGYDHKVFARRDLDKFDVVGPFELFAMMNYTSLFNVFGIAEQDAEVTWDRLVKHGNMFWVFGVSTHGLKAGTDNLLKFYDMWLDYVKSEIIASETDIDFSIVLRVMKFRGLPPLRGGIPATKDKDHPWICNEFGHMRLVELGSDSISDIHDPLKSAEYYMGLLQFCGRDDTNPNRGRWRFVCPPFSADTADQICRGLGYNQGLLPNSSLIHNMPARYFTHEQLSKSYVNSCPGDSILGCQYLELSIDQQRSCYNYATQKYQLAFAICRSDEIRTTTTPVAPAKPDAPIDVTGTPRPFNGTTVPGLRTNSTTAGASADHQVMNTTWSPDNSTLFSNATTTESTGMPGTVRAIILAITFVVLFVVIIGFIYYLASK